jgi:hypothetical protein
LFPFLVRARRLALIAKGVPTSLVWKNDSLQINKWHIFKLICD